MISGNVLCYCSMLPLNYEDNISNVTSFSNPSLQNHHEKYSLLGYYNLAGNVFKYLHTINLSYNALLLLPPEFGILVTLKECYLSYNHLETLPCTFENIESLTILHLNNNRISNMPSISKMTCLQELDLYDNELEFFPLIPSSVEFLDLAQNLREIPDVDAYYERMEKFRSKLEYQERLDYSKWKSSSWRSSSSISSLEETGLVESVYNEEDDEEEWETDNYWDPSWWDPPWPDAKEIWESFLNNIYSQGGFTLSDFHVASIKSHYDCPELPVVPGQFEDGYLL